MYCDSQCFSLRMAKTCECEHMVVLKPNHCVVGLDHMEKHVLCSGVDQINIIKCVCLFMRVFVIMSVCVEEGVLMAVSCGRMADQE